MESIDTIEGTAGSKNVDGQVTPNERVSSASLLLIDPEYWKKYDFQQITLSGDFAKILNGKVAPGEMSGGEIDDSLDSIIEQLRSQPEECKTSLSLTPDGRFLLQVNPTIGTADSVNNIFAEPSEGRKVLEIHNHPVHVDPTTHDETSYEFFSAPDLTAFAFREGTHMAEAVVFKTGTAILIKTPESERIIKEAITKTGQGRWAWTTLGNNLSKEFVEKVPNDSPEERRRFSVEFAKKNAMRLLFIPSGNRQIRVLV